jgi:hypothetical protein
LAHFARIKNGIVDFVTVGRDDDENREDELAHDGWIYQAVLLTTLVAAFIMVRMVKPSADQTKAFRKNYAGLGYTYDAERDAFIPSKALCVMGTQRRFVPVGRASSNAC